MFLLFTCLKVLQRIEFPCVYRVLDPAGAARGHDPITRLQGIATARRC